MFFKLDLEVEMKLSIGQTLYWVSAQYLREQPKEVTVTKIGRKWAYLSNNQRIDTENLIVDGGDYIPSGSVYLSKEEYDRLRDISAAWSKLRMDLQYSSLKMGITVEHITEARVLLGLD